MRTKKLDSWFHFLCKNVPVEEVKGVKHIVNRDRRDAKDLSQADFSWVRSAYCLKAKPPSQTRGWSEVTLIVFGGELLLWEKFEALSSNTSWQDILEDPCCLLDVVFEVLYARIDKLAWDLAHVYSQEEEVRNYRTLTTLEPNTYLNFRKSSDQRIIQDLLRTRWTLSVCTCSPSIRFTSWKPRKP